MKIRVVLAFMLCSILISQHAWSQVGAVEFKSPGSDSVKLVKILNADSYRFEQKDSVTALTLLVGHVRIQQEKTLIDCDSLIMNPNEHYIECFGNVHINDNDSTNIYSDYMKYLVNVKKVHFEKNVKLTDGKGILTTQDMDYDMNTKVGVYHHGGKIINNGSVLTSEEATYFEETKDVHFKGDVVLRDPQYDLSTDSLLYNTQKQLSTFITETYILFKDSTHRTVRTRSGYYDLKNKKAEFGKRPVITDGSQTITGDSVRIDDSTGYNTANGHAVYKDTAQGFVLNANFMILNKKKNTLLATQQPVMVIKQDKDSIYISADTLFSARLIDMPAIEKMEAAEADSLHRRYVDSLYKRSSDSLHRRALESQPAQDTLFNVGSDSAHQMVVSDISDSLAAGVEDSLGKSTVDSLRRNERRVIRRMERAGDSTLAIQKGLAGQRTAADSAKARGADSARIDSSKAAAGLAKTGGVKDSGKTKPLTERQQKRKEKALADLEKAKKKAQTDSVKEAASDRVRAVKDSVKAVVAAEKAKIRAQTDSVKRRTDSIRRQTLMAESRRKHAREDSIANLSRPHPNADSLRALAFADSVRAQDSIQREADKRRSDDSIQTAIIKARADSIAAIPIDSSLRYIKGYHHVRIYSDSLQAVADSLFYSGKDSIFRLYKDPVAWGSGNYQVTGDTMYVYTKNKKATRLYVFENALTINKVGRAFYNQIKGTTINCFFTNGEVDYMRAKGNAESVYYVRDDNKAYTGVNKAHADIIDMVFAKTDSSKGRELNRVVLRNDAEGSMIPFGKVNFDDMRLRGFKWQEARRPKNKFELFEPIRQIADDKSAEDKAAEIPVVPEKKAPAPEVRK
jgi:lipopolysaccharide export system protein LptA